MREQVLALNDDNHDSCFVTRTNYYSNVVDFMRECLLAPHHISYEVRQVHLCDVPEELMELYNNDENAFICDFDRLACTYAYEINKLSEEQSSARIKAFHRFWEHGDKEFHYV